MNPCPICNGPVARVVYGMPGTTEQWRNDAVMGGCIVDPGQPNFICKVCRAELETVGGAWEIAVKPAFLLTWNPEVFEISPEIYDAEVTVTEAGSTIGSSWSTGSRKHGIRVGDRAYLVRQHNDRGVIGSGRFTSEVYSGPHWSGKGGRASYANVTWEVVVPVAERLPLENLRHMVAEVPWNNLQGPGVQVAPTASARLFRVWEEHLGSIGRR